MTIFAVVCAGIFPVFHLGRVWYAWFLFPLPNSNIIWQNYRTPAGMGRLRGLHLRHGFGALLVHRNDPRPGDLRDRSAAAVRSQGGIYGFFAMGWRGSCRHWSTTRWPT